MIDNHQWHSLKIGEGRGLLKVMGGSLSTSGRPPIRMERVWGISLLCFRFRLVIIILLGMLKILSEELLIRIERTHKETTINGGALMNQYHHHQERQTNITTILTPNKIKPIPAIKMTQKINYKRKSKSQLIPIII